VNYSDEDLDVVFAALGNAHRRKIVDLLSLQPASIRQLAQQIPMSLTAINRHINVLEEAALVLRRKAGRTNFLSIRRQTMQRVQDWALQYNPSWGTDDESLENYVAGIRAADTKQNTTKASNK
jgi:DNA-binding transcriptional ArsR family regulator